MNLAFIIQARLGSTRLPNKILLPFYKGKCIFDLLLEKLSSIENVTCIVATSSSPENNQLEDICKRYNIPCFRGDETDVLKRFIDAAQFFCIDSIIRICSDNPFLNIPMIKELIQVSQSTDEDYISYSINGIPSIKTHYGLWAEYVTLDALLKIQSLTSEPIYHEHVTNYIYTHPDQFRIKWLQVPTFIPNNNQIRLTIDTMQDFNVAKKIYESVDDVNSLCSIFDYVHSHPEIAKSMAEQIKENEK